MTESSTTEIVTCLHYDSCVTNPITSSRSSRSNHSRLPLLRFESFVRNLLHSVTFTQDLRALQKPFSFSLPHRLRLPRSRRGRASNMFSIRWWCCSDTCGNAYGCSLQCRPSTPPVGSASGPMPAGRPIVLHPSWPRLCCGFRTRPRQSHVGVDNNNLAIQPC